ARRLIEAERHVELTATEVQPMDDSSVDVDVLPRARGGVELALDVVEHAAHDLALDGNPLPVRVEDVLLVRSCLGRKIAPVVLRLDANARRERVAKIDRGMLVE